MMKMRQVLMGTLVAGALFAPPAMAGVDVGIILNFGPPPPRYEIVPPPRVGYVWVPGYWDYRVHNHYWVAGYWLPARPGYYYQGPHWQPQGGRWVLERGGWHDVRYRKPHKNKDGDGIPDRADRHPKDPYRG